MGKHAYANGMWLGTRWRNVQTSTQLFAEAVLRPTTPDSPSLLRAATSSAAARASPVPPDSPLLSGDATAPESPMVKRARELRRAGSFRQADQGGAGKMFVDIRYECYLFDTGGAWRGLASGQRRERGRRPKTREAQIHIVFYMFNYEENFPDKEVTN